MRRSVLHPIVRIAVLLAFSNTQETRAATSFHILLIGKGGVNPSEVWHYVGAGTNFALVNKPATNVNTAGGLTYGPDGRIYAAAAAGTPVVIKRTTGFVHGSDATFISSGLVSPRMLDFRTNGHLYVADLGANTVKWFDTSGALAGSFAFSGAFGLDIGSDDALYVTTSFISTGRVVRLDWSGSAWTQTWAVTNLTNPQSVRQHGSYVYFGTYTASDTLTSSVSRVDAATGAVLGSTAIPAVRGILGLDFAPDGNLYISGNTSNNVARCLLDSNGDITNTTVFLTAAGSGLSFPRGLTIVQEEMPLLVAEYKFNETGTIASNSGWETIPLALYNSGGVATDLHSAPGLGLLGGLGRPGSDTDRSFNNTASTGMGNAGTGGWAQQPVDCDSMDTFASFTMSGWFKTDATALDGFARMIDKISTTSGYSAMGVSGEPGKLRMDCNGVGRSTNSTTASWSNINTWIFFAITYDGTLSSSNLKFYRGYRTAGESAGAGAAVALMSTVTLNIDAMVNNTQKLIIGNAATGNNRPFDGYLDNIRIHGVHAPGDAGGALSLAALEQIRRSDLPDGGTLVLLR